MFDMYKFKLLAAFAKWIDGEAITPQEFSSLTDTFTTIPPISTNNPQESLGILTKFAGKIAAIAQNAQQGVQKPQPRK